jgi:hypothetical protein
MMVRARVDTPVAQVLEHSLQAAQLLTMQSIGQLLVLQSEVWDEEAQALPPWATSRMVERERDIEPVPQVLEHAVQLPQEPWTQSTGQEAVLHSTVFEVTPQALPP